MMTKIYTAVWLLCFVGTGMAKTFTEGVQAYDQFNYTKAYEIWLPLAEAGNSKAQYNIGVLFEQGDGQKADAKQAFQWYKKSADLGYTKAQYRVGNAYYFGKGVDKNMDQAKIFWQHAANGGLASAQYNLAVLYVYGGTAHRDAKKANQWLQKAAKQNHQGAKNLLINLGEPIEKTKPVKVPPIPTITKPSQTSTESKKNKPAAAKKQAKEAQKKEPFKKPDWISRQVKNHYTIQLTVLSSRKQAKQFIAKHGIQNKAHAYVLKGSKMVKVIYGSYPNQTKARQAIKTLSPGLKKDGPWPKKFALVQAERGK